MWALNTCGGPNEIDLSSRLLADCVTALSQATVHAYPSILTLYTMYALQATVHVCDLYPSILAYAAKATGTPRQPYNSTANGGPIQFRLAPRTNDAPPWGVRVVSLPNSREIPT